MAAKSEVLLVVMYADGCAVEFPCSRTFAARVVEDFTTHRRTRPPGWWRVRTTPLPPLVVRGPDWAVDTTLAVAVRVLTPEEAGDVPRDGFEAAMKAKQLTLADRHIEIAAEQARLLRNADKLPPGEAWRSGRPPDEDE